MGTHAYVFEKTKEGKYRGIYLHWDGYLEYAGRVLTEHYTESAVVSSLIDLGALSILGTCIGKKVDFDGYDKGSIQCLAYHRDRDEKLEILNPKQLNEKNISRLAASYIYLFDHEKQTWYLWSRSEKDWVDLMDEIVEERDIHEYTDKELAYFWSELGDIPTVCSNNKNVLDLNWFGWRKGTDVMDIWHWFDARFSAGLGAFMETYNEQTGEIE